MKTPIRRSEVVSAVENNSWSNDVLRVALPAQYELQMTSHKLLGDVRNGYAEGNLELGAVRYVDNYLLSLAKSLVTPGLVIEGFSMLALSNIFSGVIPLAVFLLVNCTSLDTTLSSLRD